MGRVGLGHYQCGSGMILDPFPSLDRHSSSYEISHFAVHIFCVPFCSPQNSFLFGFAGYVVVVILSFI